MKIAAGSRKVSNCLLLGTACTLGIFLSFFCDFSITYGFTIDNSPSFGPSTLYSGLVGWWTLDGKDTNWTTGITNDKSGQGNNASLVGLSTTTSTIAGKLGQALSFNGSSQYVTASPASDLIGTGAATLCAWVYPKNVSGEMNIVSDGRKTWFEVYAGSGQFTVTSNGATSLNGGAYTQNVWQHFCFSRDATGAAITYLNSIQTNSGSSGTPSAPSANELDIANSAALLGTGRLFSGNVDDVRVYNRVLSAAEIKQLYLQGVGSTRSSTPTSQKGTLTNGLLGYWTFNNKDMNWTTGKAYDVSGNGNDGSLATMSTTSSPTIGKVGQALYFNGTSNYVTTNADFTSFATPNSICLWAKSTDITATSGGFNPHMLNLSFNGTATDGLRMLVTNTGVFATHYVTGSVAYGKDTVSSVFSNNVWNHVCYTWDGSSITLYANGSVAPSTSDASTNFGTGWTGALIGSRNMSGGDWNGSIDDVRIFSRALTAAEVRQIYLQGLGTALESTQSGSSRGCALSTLNCGLVGYWTFNNQDMNWVTGKAYDKSGNGNDGSLVSMSTTTGPVIGKMGQALSFDGATQSVSLPDSSLYSPGTGNFSIGAWVKTSLYNTSDSQDIWNNYGAAANNAAGIDLKGSNANEYFEATVRDGGGNAIDVVGNQVLALNTWYHVFMVKNGTTVTSYVNGVQDNSGSNALLGTITLSDGNIPTIGRNILGGGWYKGAIDDVRYYNRALQASEIKQLYLLGK